MNASRCGAFARKWLFLRDCGHLTNVHDLLNAQHLRGALILEFRRSARTLPGIFLIVFLISNRIIFIISITIIFVVFYFYHYCIYYFLFLSPLYLLGLFLSLLFLIVLHCYLYLYQFYICYLTATVQYRLNHPYEPRRRYKMP